eukprot:g5114.t1
MAFFQLTSRDQADARQNQASAPHCGPGSYDITPKWGVRPQHVPFGSTSVRKNLGNASYGPGPGAYSTSVSLQSTNIKTPSKSSFKSETVRFHEMKDDGSPAPGQYTPKGNPWIKKGSRRGLLGPKNFGVSKKSRISWVKHPSAPTIPSTDDQWGYDETEDGILVKQSNPIKGYSGRKGDLPGPGHYKTSNQFTDSLREKRGVGWSKSRTTRTKFIKSDIPGPKYDLDKKPKKRKQMSAVFRSETKRQGLASKDTVPSGYKIESEFDKIAKRKVPDSIQFFGSTAVRFKRPGQDTQIGPGRYNTAQSTFGKSRRRQRRHPTQAPVAFNSTAARSIGKLRKSSSNDSFYTIEGFAEKIIRESKKANRAGRPTANESPFGSSTRRFATNGKDDSESPPFYNVGGFESLKTKQAKKRKSSAFASKTVRFQELPPNESPMYNVEVSWKTGNRSTGTIGYGKERFIADKAKEIPGPGAYKTSGSFKPAMPSRTNTFISRADRFKEGRAKPIESPGPGSSSAEYLYGNMMKRTFNMKIAEQMYRN